MWLRLFFLSVLRYAVFNAQFYFLLSIPSFLALQNVVWGMSLYFMVTSVLPMISVVEAAIRAAVALAVLPDSALAPSQLAFSAVLLWLLNIVVPSLIGYLALLRLKVNVLRFLPVKHKNP